MAKVVFQNEEGQNLNRYLITPTDGSVPFTADLARAADITKQGTPYNKEVGDHFLQIEDGVPIQPLTCTKNGTIYALTGLTATEGVAPVMFTADAAYATGDTVTVDGTAYTLATRDGTSLMDGAWVAEAIVIGSADVDNLILYIEPSGIKKSSLVTATLTAAGWTGSAAPYSQTVPVAGVTATSANELLPGSGITAEQLKALQAANIQDGSQAAGSITVKAYGDKPTINLPVRIIVRGDL